MTIFISGRSQERVCILIKREQQRVDHLVLGRARPAPIIGPKPKGISKSEWKVTRADLRARGATLLTSIEERVQLAELYGSKQGTPETIAKLEERQRRPGAIARLYQSGAIDADQLAAADKIADAYRWVKADKPLRTASWETRTGGSGGEGMPELPALGSVLAEWALDWWLRGIQQPEAMLAIVAQDVALTIAANRHGLSVPRARKLVGLALTKWWNRYGRGDVVAS